MYAYTNILAALIERGDSGRGKAIDVSMLESMVEWMGYPLYYAFDGAAPPPRRRAPRTRRSIRTGPFPAGDGKTVMLGLQNEREWAAFCERVLQRPELAATRASRPTRARTAHRAGAARDHRRGVRRHTPPTQVIARLDAAQIANARMNDMGEVWAHPQLAARRRWIEVDTPAGPIRALLPPGAAGRAASRAWMPVPALGQHTEAILRRAGLRRRTDRAAARRTSAI